MLKVRVIPTLLGTQFGLVKGANFNSWRRVGSILPAIKVYNQREVDELILLDIEAHRADEGPDLELLKELSKDCFIPLTVGGGITRVEQVQKLLYSGADKISINTAFFDNPNLIDEIAKKHGSQCLVLSIDAKKKIGLNKWECFSQAGSIATGWDAVNLACQAEARGCGEILITSIDRDGTFEGYDLALIKSIVDAVKIPVIASGGAGCYQDMIEAVQLAGASAVAAASIFHFTELTPLGAKKAMMEAGIPVRMSLRDNE